VRVRKKGGGEKGFSGSFGGGGGRVWSRGGLIKKKPREKSERVQGAGWKRICNAPCPPAKPVPLRDNLVKSHRGKKKKKRETGNAILIERGRTCWGGGGGGEKNSRLHQIPAGEPSELSESVHSVL